MFAPLATVQITGRIGHHDPSRRQRFRAGTHQCATGQMRGVAAHATL